MSGLPLPRDLPDEAGVVFELPPFDPAPDTLSRTSTVRSPHGVIASRQECRLLQAPAAANAATGVAVLRPSRICVERSDRKCAHSIVTSLLAGAQDDAAVAVPLSACHVPGGQRRLHRELLRPRLDLEDGTSIVPAQVCAASRV